MARKRRTPPSARPRGDAPRPPVGLVLQICRSAREALGGFRVQGIDAELWASGLVGSIGWRINFPDDRAEALGDLVDEIASVPRPGAREALYALATVGQEAFGDRARAAAERIGGPRPRWAMEAGTGRLVSVWTVTDPAHDDGTTYALEIARPFGGHVLCVYVDNNIGGIPKDAFLVPSLRDFTAPFAKGANVGLVLAEANPDDAIGRLRAAVEHGRRFLEPPTSEELRDLDALIEGHLRFLPAGVPPPDDEPLDEHARAALAASFLASPEGRGHAKGDGRDVLETILWFACDYNVGGPLRWSPVVVEVFCDWVGRKVVADRRSIARIPAVLRAFVRYAGRVRGIPDRRLAETLAAVDARAGDLVGRDRASLPFGEDDAMLRMLLGEVQATAEEVLLVARIEAAVQLAMLTTARPDEAVIAAAAARVRAARGPDRALRIALRELAGRRRLPSEADLLLMLMAGACASPAGAADLLGDDEGTFGEINPDDWVRIVEVALGQGRITAAQIGRRLASSRGPVADIPARDRTAIGAEIVAAWQLSGALAADGATTPIAGWLIPTAIVRTWEIPLSR